MPKMLDDKTYKALGVKWPEQPKIPDGMFARIPTLESALRDAPDIGAYDADKFYDLYTKWFEVTRRDALRALAIGPEYNGGDTPPV
jgi:hypothetical protein